jgi:hypothetical protein
VTFRDNLSVPSSRVKLSALLGLIDTLGATCKVLIIMSNRIEKWRNGELYSRILFISRDVVMTGHAAVGEMSCLSMLNAGQRPERNEPHQRRRPGQ